MSNGIKVLLGVLGGAVLVLVLLPVFAGSGLFGGSSMMGPGGMMGGWGFFGIIWMLVPLLFLGGLIAVIVWAVTQLASGRHDASSAGVHQQPAEEMLRQRSAEEILRQRFARGEIDAEEYEERRRILNEQHRGEEGPK